MTGSVRSLVKNIFLTIFSPLGSIKRPTLSQLPAKCKGANVSSFLTISFKFIPIALGVDDIFLKIIFENIQLSQQYKFFRLSLLVLQNIRRISLVFVYKMCKKVRKYVTSEHASKFEGRSISFISIDRVVYFLIQFSRYFLKIAGILRNFATQIFFSIGHTFYNFKMLELNYCPIGPSLD